MDGERTISDLSGELEALPDDLREDLLEFHRGSFRLTLTPGYRTETLFGRPTGCAHPYVLLASGLGETTSAGEFVINVANLLHCVGPGAPMPGGLLSPVQSGTATVVPGSGTVALGAPVTVVTGSGAKPALFTASPEGFASEPPSQGQFFPDTETPKSQTALLLPADYD